MNTPQEICCWNASSNNGAFQKWVDIGNGEIRLWSYLLTEKPEFNFEFTSMEFIPEINRFTINSVPNVMTQSNADSVRDFISSLEPPKEWFVDQLCVEPLNYLASTDWYIIREADNGNPIPAEIKTKREEARQIISQVKDGE